MKQQAPHAMLPQANHDEASRESCVASMRRFFTAELIPANRELYDKRLRPSFEAEHGRPPESAAEVATLMNGAFYYRATSLFGRATQELLWDTVGEMVERQQNELIEKARPKGNAIGSLELHPEIPMPDYIEAVDIHLMPGNFQTELRADDVLAGALYDRGAYVFAYGSRGAYNENLGVIVAQMIKSWFPDFSPKRILEMGCGTGASTLPLKAAWPDADVSGIDVGAPMVRYAHARAEALGVPLHFSQQNAVRTDFPDGSFDLVVSMLVNHEMPLDVYQNILRECHRLLAPGGITLHDGSVNGNKPPADPFQQFMSGWFSRNINEPYGQGFDAERDFQKAGFTLDDMFSGVPDGDNYLKGQISGHNYVGAVRR
jgi:ubiquinone/menaquinone biosynthesis C-methylase UbiE